jgi:hypothetical protein
MSYLRHAKKVDSSQEAIVKALRKAGVDVYVIGRPVDLLCYVRGSWKLLEAKAAPEPGIRVKLKAPHKRKDQVKQDEFIARYKVPVVRTPQEAVAAIIQRTDKQIV